MKILVEMISEVGLFVDPLLPPPLPFSLCQMLISHSVWLQTIGSLIFNRCSSFVSLVLSLRATYNHKYTKRWADVLISIRLLSVWFQSPAALVATFNQEQPRQGVFMKIAALKKKKKAQAVALRNAAAVSQR
jgi:hypothetical protein